MRDIVLASASPRRKELLEQIGVRFRVVPSLKEEVITKSVPKDVVGELASQKAYEVFEKCPNADMIIGADTMVVCNQRIMGKPANKEQAITMLSMLQGQVHYVYTGVTVILKNGEAVEELSFVESTEVTMYPITMDQIEEYVATKEPMDKAGAYAIQGKSAIFIKELKGDYHNVVGLPIGRLYQELYKRGVDIRH
ncbi:MAG TPA: septum formation inhibitor Maf [Candidatus Merdenecus merdavium]|nr:septum formation inhibitor Maf [Candidatus Merdenecus merdavium]